MLDEKKEKEDEKTPSMPSNKSKPEPFQSNLLPDSEGHGQGLNFLHAQANGPGQDFR